MSLDRGRKLEYPEKTYKTPYRRLQRILALKKPLCHPICNKNVLKILQKFRTCILKLCLLKNRCVLEHRSFIAKMNESYSYHFILLSILCFSLPESVVNGEMHQNCLVSL